MDASLVGALKVSSFSLGTRAGGRSWELPIGHLTDILTARAALVASRSQQVAAPRVVSMLEYVDMLSREQGRARDMKSAHGRTAFARGRGWLGSSATGVASWDAKPAKPLPNCSRVLRARRVFMSLLRRTDVALSCGAAAAWRDPIKCVSLLRAEVTCVKVEAAISQWMAACGAQSQKRKRSVSPSASHKKNKASVASSLAAFARTEAHIMGRQSSSSAPLERRKRKLRRELQRLRAVGEPGDLQLDKTVGAREALAHLARCERRIGLAEPEDAQPRARRDAIERALFKLLHTGAANVADDAELSLRAVAGHLRRLEGELGLVRDGREEKRALRVRAKRVRDAARNAHRA